MAFTKKSIEVKIGLGQGQFGNEPGSNVVTLSGYRTTVDMQAFVGDSMGQVLCKVYGLPLLFMNELTTIGINPTQFRMSNKISISVGDTGQPLQQIFTGVIDTAIADFQEYPNVALVITALSAYDAALTPMSATSFKGPQSVESILQSVLNTMNAATPGQVMTLVNHGVDVTLTDAYLPGAGLAQIKAVAQAGRFSYRIDSVGTGEVSSNTLQIWPNATAVPESVITISPTSDPFLIGYPTVSANTIALKCLFVNARFGTPIIVSGSQIKQANASWVCTNVQHNLESEKPGGTWQTIIAAAYQGVSHA